MTMHRAVWLGVLVLAAGDGLAVVKESSALPPGPAAAATATAIAAEAEDANARSAARAVATDYLMAVNAKGLDGGVPYLHPDELVRFKKRMIPILDQERQAGRRNLLNATFGRQAEMTDVRLADPADFMARFARVASARLDAAPTRFDRVEAIGALPEGEVLHMLVREITEQGGSQTQRLVVVSLKRSGKDWKVLFGNDLEALLAGFAAAPAGREPVDRRAQPLPEAAPLEPGGAGAPPAPRR